MKNKAAVVIMLVGLLVLLTACNGVGNLRVITYGSQKKLLDDIYVGIYTSNFNKRVKFGYTVQGEVNFKALEEGVYGVKIVGEGIRKKTRIKVKGKETTYLEVSIDK